MVVYYELCNNWDTLLLKRKLGTISKRTCSKCCVQQQTTEDKLRTSHSVQISNNELNETVSDTIVHYNRVKVLAE